MKNKHTAFSLLIFFLFWGAKVHAQNPDSVEFSKVEWQIHPIKKGVVWKQANIQGIFKSQQEINIIEINLKKHSKKIHLAALPKSREKTSTLARRHNAILALNGGFFDMKNGGAVDFTKVNHQIINTTVAKSARANAYLAFDAKKLIITDDSTQTNDFPNVLLAGPLLLKDGSSYPLSKNPFNDNRHPRTAIALKENTLILLTVDGRNAKSQGLTLGELEKILRWYGCQSAMNLDGGGSTTMYIKGQPDHGIVNYPSDNKLFDHKGERAVSNIIYLTN
ncbi:MULTISPECIES: phosphodiester glycosidase family protein [Sphingobacterium]|uniref:phosphodiester glycosidase family protein n=1 Tax=Sphingobacterium TaxID=28453 RepID=UPI0013DC7CF4|nr:MULTISPECIES: phosphodiester glycosidase family protein [unclassified Sphingobacterium]